MSKFTVKDLGLEYRMTVGGALIQQTTSGLEYQNYPLDNTYTRHCNLSVEGYAMNDEVDYEGLLENAELTCYETTELINVGLKIIDLKQLGRPIGFPNCFKSIILKPIFAISLVSKHSSSAPSINPS